MRFSGQDALLNQPVCTFHNLRSLDTDLLARGIGGIGVAIGLLCLFLIGSIWRRANPRLKVTVFMKAAKGELQLEVLNAGLITVEVRRLEIWHDAGVSTPQGYYAYPSSDWTKTTGLPLPTMLNPGSHLEWSFEVGPLVAGIEREQEIWVRGWAQRGDDRWYSSKRLRLK